MNTALAAIVGSMYINGYLSTESNSILVIVDSSDVNKTDALLLSITESINTVFEKSELECSIIAQSLKVDDTLKNKAAENEISVGKMHLIDKMVSGMDDYSNNDTASLADMSIKELNLIYSNRPKKDEEWDPFEKDISSGNIGGFISQIDALTLLLESIEAEMSSVEWYRINVKPNSHNEGRQMVYRVQIRFVADTYIHEFEIDCQSGKITEQVRTEPELNINPDNPSAPSLDKSNEESTPPSPDSSKKPCDESSPDKNGINRDEDGGSQESDKSKEEKGEEDDQTPFPEHNEDRDELDDGEAQDSERPPSNKNRP